MPPKKDDIINVYKTRGISFFIYLCQLLYHCQNNSKKTVFQANSGNFPEFFKIFQKDIIIMQSGPFFYNI